MATKATTVTASITPIKALVAAAMLVPAVLLALFGYAHFRDGVAWDNAVPVPVYMVARELLPNAAYVHAAESLIRSNPRNGEAALTEVEARWRAGEAATLLLPKARDGLTREPGSARGWYLLSEISEATDKTLAGAAIAQSVYLAPREFYLIAPRLQQAANVWSSIDRDGQSVVLEQVRLEWNTPELRQNFLSLSSAPGGAGLISRAFGADEIRSINRWLAHERRKAGAP